MGVSKSVLQIDAASGREKSLAWWRLDCETAFSLDGRNVPPGRFETLEKETLAGALDFLQHLRQVRLSQFLQLISHPKGGLVDFQNSTEVDGCGDQD